ncbi:MAG: phosphatase PAP2 family protein [Acidobacteriota bacterium]
MQRPSTRTLATANMISMLGHPLVLGSLTVTLSLVGHLPAARLLAVVGIFTAAIVFPIWFVIRRKVASGAWTDMDVSDHGQRAGLYSVALSIIALSIPIFWLLELPRGLIIGTLVSLVLLLAGMAINLRSKLSMHSMFGAYCVVILMAVSVAFGLAALLLIAAVGWSRVVLGRHTVAQVVFGMSLGAAAGVVLFWLVRQ